MSLVNSTSAVRDKARLGENDGLALLLLALAELGPKRLSGSGE